MGISGQRRATAEAADAGPQGPPAAGRWGAHSSTLVWGVVFVVLVWLYATLGRHVYGGDSDVATLVLQGQAVNDGHPTLHGWWFLLDSFWTVEVPLYTIGYRIVGLRAELMYVIPAVFTALLVLVGVALARRGRSGRAATVATCVCLALVAVPSNQLALLLLRGGWHVATTVYCMLAFACLYKPAGRWRWAAAVALLALGQVGDLQTVVIGTAPVAAAGLLAIARTRRWRSGVPLLAAAVAAPVGALVIRRLAVAIGTYQIGRANPHATVAQMEQNVKNLPGWLGLAFGSSARAGDTLGQPVVLALFRSVAVVVVAAAVVLTAVITIRAAVRGEQKGETEPSANGDATPAWRLDDMLVVACLADLAFFVYATLASDHAYLRYLTPFVALGSVLAARVCSAPAMMSRLPRSLPVRRSLAGGLVALAAVWTVGFVHDLTRPEPALVASGLYSALEAHHLHLGLGYYWVANSSTVASDGRVVIRPVRADRGHRIVRREQLSADTWYGKPFEFLVFDWRRPFEGVNLANATRTFGPPTGMFRVGSSEVLTWSHSITVGP